MFKVTIVGAYSQNKEFLCDSGQSLSSAARAQAVKLPYACMGGGCGICKIKVLDGSFDRGPCSKSVLPDEERSRNYTLACKTYPGSDLKIQIPMS